MSSFPNCRNIPKAEFPEKENSGSQGRRVYPGSEAAAQVFQTMSNPPPRNQAANLSGRNLDLDRPLLSRSLRRSATSSTGDVAHHANSPAPQPSTQEWNRSATEPSQQSQGSRQSTQDSCSHGLTYPYDDSFPTFRLEDVSRLLTRWHCCWDFMGRRRTQGKTSPFPKIHRTCHKLSELERRRENLCHFSRYGGFDPNRFQ
jgi:hypothetical protein